MNVYVFFRMIPPRGVSVTLKNTSSPIPTTETNAIHRALSDFWAEFVAIYAVNTCVNKKMMNSKFLIPYQTMSIAIQWLEGKTT